MKMFAAVIMLIVSFRGLALGAGSGSVKRPMTPRDLNRIEEVDLPIMSPDSELITFVYRRPRAGNDSESAYEDPLEGYNRGDVWISDVVGGKPRRITNGVETRSGYFLPIWSPDSNHLAFLSAHGEHVQLMVWDRQTNESRLAFDQDIDLFFALTSPCEWLSSTALVCAVLPQGTPSLPPWSQSTQAATNLWRNRSEGASATVDVLNSGLQTPSLPSSTAELLFWDVESGVSDHLKVHSREVAKILVSPDRQSIAVLRLSDSISMSEIQIIHERIPYEVTIVHRGNDSHVAETPVIGPSVTNDSVSWSPSGKELLLEKIPVDSDTGHRRWFRCHSGELCKAIAIEGCEVCVKKASWSPWGELVLFGSTRLVVSDVKNVDRADWWTSDGSGVSINLTKQFKESPAELYMGMVPDTFVALSQGKLWTIRPGAQPKLLAEPCRSELTSSIVWPRDSQEQQMMNDVIVACKGESERQLLRVDLASGRISPVAEPTFRDDLLAYSERESSGVFWGRDLATPGNAIVVCPQQARPCNKVIETNTFLSEIAPGESRHFAYTDADGQELKAWLLLPVGYEPGKKYPTITWVYAGLIDERPDLISERQFNNQQLLAAHGYAVLIPSMPLQAPGKGSDPLFDLMKGVIPAVDKAIELGIADPNRLGLMGHSYGGYSTYGIIAQTNRFKAAVASAGISDLVSIAGQFSTLRYSPLARLAPVYTSMSMEDGQMRMGSPLWKDPLRYVRNSPIFYADRINTPLMIVQGDLDPVPIQQGEEMFTALYRQGKRASFVRYWGEGHLLEGKANIEDFWSKVYAWFEEFLKPETVNGSPK